ncbi:hypothetical protein NUACC26_017720 [Scytonema sp. NUACC26]
MERFHCDRLLSSRVKRRRFLLGAGAVTTGFLTTQWHHGVLAQPSFSGYPFSLGIASGDPLPDSVVLWTRLAPDLLKTTTQQFNCLRIIRLRPSAFAW